MGKAVGTVNLPNKPPEKTRTKRKTKQKTRKNKKTKTMKKGLGGKATQTACCWTKNNNSNQQQQRQQQQISTTTMTTKPATPATPKEQRPAIHTTTAANHHTRERKGRQGNLPLVSPKPPGGRQSPHPAPPQEVPAGPSPITSNSNTKRGGGEGGRGGARALTRNGMKRNGT